MANPFYNASGSPVTGSPGLSAVIRAEFAAINAGFNLLPNVLTPNYFVVVNGAGTALTVTNSVTGATFQDPIFSGNVTFAPASIFTLPDGSIWNSVGLQHAVASVVSMPDLSQWKNTGLTFVPASIVKFPDLGLWKSDGISLVTGVSIRFTGNGDTTLRMDNAANAGNASRMIAIMDNGSVQFVISHPGTGYTPGNIFNQPNTTGIYTTGSSLNIGTLNAAPIKFCTGTAEKMRLDAAGNLGLRRIPEAWGANYPVMGVGIGGALAGNTATPQIALYNNLFFDGAVYRYITADFGAVYAINSGIASWFTAPIGVVGASTVLTERLRLDTAGNLGIGVVPTDILTIQRDQAAQTAISLTNVSGANGASTRLTFSNGTSFGVMLQTGTGTPIVAGSGDRPNGTQLVATGAGGMVFKVPDNTVPGGLITSAYSWFMASVEKMRIWPSGGVSIGDFFAYASDPALAGRLALHGQSGGVVFAYNSGVPNASQNALITAPDSSGIVSQSGNTAGIEHYRFNNPNGTVGRILVTGSATSFVTSSDETLKNFSVPQRDFKALINAILIRDGEFISEPGVYRLMMSAQQVYGAGYTDAAIPPIVRTPEQIAFDVSCGIPIDPPKWGGDYARLAPLALWGVKDLYTTGVVQDARITAIEARLLAAGIP